MQPGRRNALLLTGVGIAAAVAGALIGALALQSGSGAARLLSASFVDLQGSRRRLIDWQGSVLVCNFWATWCAPCREEVPLLVAAKQQYAARGLEIVGIGLDSAEKIANFAAIYKINYPMLIADSGAVELMRDIGNRTGALPYTVFLDRTGAISVRKLGAFRKDELDQAVQRLLG